MSRHQRGTSTTYPRPDYRKPASAEQDITERLSEVQITWRTMTVGGIYGSDYLAPDADTAEAMAEAGGYEVLDVTELGDEHILVIAD